MGNDLDSNLIPIFLQESRDHLDGIEPHLLAMEKDGENCPSPTIDRVFRAVHTIKGGAGMLDLTAVTSIAHAMENVLSKVRDRTLKPSTIMMDLLFQCIDKLKAMLDDINNSNNISISEEIARLAALQNSLDQPNHADKIPESCLLSTTSHASSPAPDTEKPRASATSGFHLFADDLITSSTINTAPTTLANTPVVTAPAMVTSAASNRPDPQSGGSGAQSAVVTKETETIRVKVDLLNHLMNTAGELVLGRNQLLSTLRNSLDQNRELATILQNIDRITSQLQEEVMQTRMQPIGILFGRFTRMMRDLAKRLGKEIELTTTGAEVELDKSIIELLSDPITHIVRNCADHGIETGAERIASGKAAKGTVTFKAFHDGGRVHVVIGDDGKGIDPEQILQKAIEKGLVDPIHAKTLNEKEIVKFIFAPGFSTAEVVSEVSGRGVGMDVVRTNIEKLGGSVEIKTTPRVGTTVILSLPLTVAIIPALIVGDSGHLFAVPQVNIVEIVDIKAADITQSIVKVSDAPVLRLREKLLPVIRLADVLQMPRTFYDPTSKSFRDDRRRNIADRRRPKRPSSTSQDAAVPHHRNTPERRQNWRSDYYVLVLRSGADHFGLIVAELHDSQEVVVKPVASFVQKNKCFAGATILGNGRVILIIDVSGVVKLGQLKFIDHSKEELDDHRGAVKQEIKQSIVLFNASPEETFAAPQEKILRIEKITAKDIQVVGKQEFINRQDHAIEIIRLDAHLPVSPTSNDASDLYLIIPRVSNENRTHGPGFGILASNIIDAVDTELNIQKSDLTHPGVLGNIIYNDRLVLYVDPMGFAHAQPPSE